MSARVRQPALTALSLALPALLAATTAAQVPPAGPVGRSPAAPPAAAAGSPGFVVDDDGGPGVDFTDIQSAVDAVPEGSILFVQPGTYMGFVQNDKGLVVIGYGAPAVLGRVLVLGLGPGKQTALAGLRLGELDVQGCAGTVLLEELFCSESLAPADPAREALVEILASNDVRAHKVAVDLSGQEHGGHAVLTESSRLEVAGGNLRAADGGDTTDGTDGIPGGFGLLARNARTHLALTAAAGGTGGEQTGYGRFGGRGGHGVRVEDQGELILAGEPTRVVAGAASGDSVIGSNGPGGDAVALFRDGGPKSVRFSGLQLAPGSGGASGPDGRPLGLSDSDVVVAPVDPDPSIELLDTPVAGSPAVLLRVHGAPGAVVTLTIGSQPLVLPSAGAIEHLVSPDQILPIGTLPPSGQADVQVPLSGLTPGALLYAQAEAGLPGGGGIELSNSIAILVR